MKLKDRLKDSYVIGVILALICLPSTYFIADGIRSLVVKYKSDPYIYPPPFAQLVTLLFNIIIFRWIMVNLEKEKIGKAYFFIIAISIFVYFFVYHKLRSQ